MSQTSTTLVLNEGKTLNYLIPLLFCGIASLISFVFFFPLGILLAIVAISLGLVETGLEFNAETMEYRKFRSLFDSKWGEWKKIENPECFHLHLSVESYSYRVPMVTSPAFSFSGGSTVKNKTITYDVTVHTKSGQKIGIYEFASYKTALKLAAYLNAIGSVEVIDHVALKLEENYQKRMNRRR